MLLEYFNDPFVPKPRPNCCDNCTRGLSSQRLSQLYDNVDDEGFVDFTSDAKIIMDAFQYTRENYEQGYNVIDIVIGKRSVEAKKYSSSPVFGSGRCKSRAYWEVLVSQLIAHNFLENTSVVIKGRKPFTLTVVKTEGIDWMNATSLPTLRLKAIGAMYPFLNERSLTSNNVETYSRFLDISDLNPMTAQYAKKMIRILLQELRNELAVTVERHMPICSDDALRSLAEKRPKNIDELKACHITGFDDTRIRKFGPTFVNGIKKLLVIL